MNPTHQQENPAPEPAADGRWPADALTAILADPARFRAHIAEQVAMALPGRPGQSEAGNGYVVTDVGLQSLADADAVEAPGTAGQVLRDAALYLDRHGWIQGAYYDPTATIFTPAADMVGAIAMVCYGGPCEAPAQHFDHPGFLDFEEAVLHLDRYLLAEDGSESYEFNDARGRRAADVTFVLRDAASRPAHELIDALRVISEGPSLDRWLVDHARALTPGGATTDPDCLPWQDEQTADDLTGPICHRCGDTCPSRCPCNCHCWLGDDE